MKLRYEKIIVALWLTILLCLAGGFTVLPEHALIDDIVLPFIFIVITGVVASVAAAVMAEASENQYNIVLRYSAAVATVAFVLVLLGLVGTYILLVGALLYAMCVRELFLYLNEN